jgi:hypothetical protein
MIRTYSAACLLLATCSIIALGAPGLERPLRDEFATHGIEFREDKTKAERPIVEITITRADLPAALAFRIAATPTIVSVGFEDVSPARKDYAPLLKSKYVKSIALIRCPSAASSLEPLKACSAMQDLLLIGCTLTEKDVAILREFKTISRLFVKECVHEASFYHCFSDIAVETLSLVYPHRFDSDAIKRLATSKSLKRISITSTVVPDNVIREFALANRLTDLSIICGALSDNHFDKCGRFPSLVELGVFSSLVTDETVKRVSDFTSIESVFLSSSKITPTGLDNLTRCQKLCKLSLATSRPVFEEMPAIKAKFPKCDVAYVGKPAKTER